ncbi:non-reducing end alpha-L-arabinofuranosidase family hydrolase [Streptomyces globisporus]|uniref:non-reducing end alpha-L-arabinofuranosidase family hydrolase n=1 Tax=Streptomyces globisporus TaxID=1908 RepID=UPI0004CC8834|nr:non-reducing end alpha-L-arabinofuranosidase family hydrolase [Streptomyces globisporus]
MRRTLGRVGRKPGGRTAVFATVVTFPGAWTRDIGHGELVRASDDQTPAIDPCRLRYVHQDMDPVAGDDRLRPPRRRGPLTRTDSPC